MSKISAISEWMAKTRKPITWIYCSAVLFPLIFSVVATVILTVRHSGPASHSGWHGFFTSFYLVLMIMLAAVPRSVLPAVLLWLVIIRFKPVWDANPVSRYLGLIAILAAALFSHAKVYDRPFNFIWLGVAALAVILPRLALPSLRPGLRGS
ncbi:MAG: hypothetical protein ABIY63_21100 [Fibrobacteria bacterium]